MRNKLIFVAGVGVGYVLGTRAGREKFDQMVAQARKFWESPTVQEAAGVVQAQATRIYDDGKQIMTDQVHRLSRKNGVALDDTTLAGRGGEPRESWETAGTRGPSATIPPM